MKLVKWFTLIALLCAVSLFSVGTAVALCENTSSIFMFSCWL